MLEQIAEYIKPEEELNKILNPDLIIGLYKEYNHIKTGYLDNTNIGDVKSIYISGDNLIFNTSFDIQCRIPLDYIENPGKYIKNDINEKCRILLEDWLIANNIIDFYIPCFLYCCKQKLKENEQEIHTY